MKKLIVTLPEKYRQAIEWTELGDMPQRGMADRLGISVSGAKSRVQRARALLKKRLQEDLLLETDRYGNVLTCLCRCPSAC
jgi:RNA polymerase sigma-70 factor (ECF subfamily)